MGKRSNKFQIQLNFIMTDFFTGKLGLSWDISFYHNNYPYSNFCIQTCCCRAEVVWKTQYPYSILAGSSAFRVTLSTFFFFVTPMVLCVSLSPSTPAWFCCHWYELGTHPGRGTCAPVLLGKAAQKQNTADCNTFAMGRKSLAAGEPEASSSSFVSRD